MEKRFMKTAEILHAVLILAPVFPLIMMLHPDRAESMLFPAYVLGWMILPFAAVMRYAVWKTRLYGQYLLACAACMACAAVLSHLAGRLLFPRAATAAGFTAAVTAELFLLFLDYDRLRRKEVSRRRALRENDLSWEARSTAFERPAPPFALLFAVYYAAALLTACPLLCNISVASLAVYFVMAAFYEWMRARNEYLGRVSYISHIPCRRIRQIGGVTLALCLAVLSLALIPCYLTAGRRQYRDLRKYRPSLVMTDEEVRALMRQEEDGAVFDPEWLPEAEEQGEPSPVMTAILRIVGAGALLVFLIAMLRHLKQHFAEFRDRFDEDNGDLAETIRDDAPAPARLSVRRARRRGGGEREDVRREYRRTVRRHRKEIPEAWEAPSEIEEKAGIAGTPAGQDLHRRYEEARYGS